MKKRRQYMIPFVYDHMPEYFDFVRVNETDIRKVKRLASCIFGNEIPHTICYEDVEE